MAKKKINDLYTTAIWRDNHQCVGCGSTKNVAVYLDDPNFPPTLDNLKTFCVICICNKRKIKLKVHNPSPELIMELRANGIPDIKIAKEYLGCSRQYLYLIMEDYTKAKKRLGLA